MPQDLADLRAALDRLGQLVDALKATTDPALALAPEVRGRLLEGLLGDLARASGEAERIGEANARRLQSEHTAGKVNTQMQSAHRLSISEGRAPGDAFIAHIRANGKYSLRSLADKLDISPSTLSAHRKRKRHKNSRPIPPERAAEIQRLTKWPADEDHWPAGIAD